MRIGGPSELGVLLLIGAAGAFLAQRRPPSSQPIPSHPIYSGPGRLHYRVNALELVVLSVVLVVGAAVASQFTLLTAGLCVACLALAGSEWHRGNWADARRVDDAETARQSTVPKFRWGDAVVIAADAAGGRHRGARGVIVEALTEGKQPRYIVQFADGATEVLAETILQSLDQPAGG